MGREISNNAYLQALRRGLAVGLVLGISLATVIISTVYLLTVQP